MKILVASNLAARRVGHRQLDHQDHKGDGQGDHGLQGGKEGRSSWLILPTKMVKHGDLTMKVWVLGGSKHHN